MAALPNIVTLANVGGKKFDADEVEDAATDGSADEWNAVAAIATGATRTLDRAWCTFTGHATTPVLVDHDAVWGDVASAAPIVTRTGTGVYPIEWPTTITDALGNVETVDIRAVKFSVSGSTAYHVTYTITAPNIITVRVFNASGTANNGAGVTFSVWWS